MLLTTASDAAWIASVAALSVGVTFLILYVFKH